MKRFPTLSIEQAERDALRLSMSIKRGTTDPLSSMPVSHPSTQEMAKSVSTPMSSSMPTSLNGTNNTVRCDDASQPDVGMHSSQFTGRKLSSTKEFENHIQQNYARILDAESLSMGQTTQSGFGSSLGRLIPRPFLFLRNKSLRTQLLVSFGLTALISIGFIVLASTLTTQVAGQMVTRIGTQNMDDRIESGIGGIAKGTADIGTRKAAATESMLLLLTEITQERFIGYPYANDYTNTDRDVPFRNYFATGDNDTNVYPFKAVSEIPLD